MKEYVEAVREAGMKVGIYYSLIDWSDPRYRSVYPEGMKKEDCLNDIYGSPAGGEEDPKKWEEFLKFNNDQLGELMTNYGTVDLLWFDGDWERSAKQWKAKEFKAYLESIGDSIVCVADEDVVKIHVHTNDPGLAIQKALTYGQLSRMKIDNMREEHQEKLIKDAEKLAAAQKEKEKAKEPRKKVGFIAVSIGEGLNEIFKELGVDYIIEGGQTMNPSTEDMLTAIDHVNADYIYILPNNKNIVMAANQARDLTEDKDIIVIPTKTVPQGITAVLNYNAEEDVDTNEETMLEAIKCVKTGQVTYAVRDTHIDDKEIHEGDIMGIGDAGILAVGKSVDGTTKDMLAQLVNDDSELISLYYGEEVSEEEAEKLTAEIEELYPDMDVDAHMGGQPIYYYVLAVE